MPYTHNTALSSWILVFIILLLPLISTTSHAISLYQIGNSLTYDSYPFNQAFVAVANTNGESIQTNGWHVRAGRQLNYIYENPEDPANLLGPSGNWQTALSGSNWGAITMQPYNGGNSTMATDAASILDWINLSSIQNPSTKYYIYAAWPQVSITQTYSDQWLASSSNTDNQATVLSRAYFQNLLSSIEKQTNASAKIIPIGEVWYRIDQHARAGQLKYITSAYDLYRDQLHANDIGKSVIAWTMYTSIFNHSAIGVVLPPEYSAYPGQGPFLMDDELANQLQIIVDSVVLSSFSSNIDSNGDGITDSIANTLGLDPMDPDGDTDNDGKSDLIEIGIDIYNPYDSDVDNVIDALEADPADIDPRVASGLRLPNSDTVTITSSMGEMLSQVRAFPATNEPANIQFPFGIVDYVTTSPPGGMVTVRMEFSSGLPANLALYKVDKSDNYTVLPSDTWSKVNSKTIDIILSDGDVITDLDGLVNSSIHDPIAIGNAASIGGSSNGGGGCTININARTDPIWLFLLLAPSIYYARKRAINLIHCLYKHFTS